jgi:two-component sensor histidine kinase/CheY-like chemotaxis protein
MFEPPLAAPDELTNNTGSNTNFIPIRVLILEDRAEDAELMVHELRRSWFEPVCHRLETEPEYLEGLKSEPDVILADYRMPQLDARRALELLQQQGLDIPFLVVSGAIGEDAAVALMRQGATDYLLKDRLRRLGPAVRRALADKQIRQEKRDAEKALRASEARFYSFMAHNPALAFIKDRDGRILYMNHTCEQAWSMSVPPGEGNRTHELRPDDLSVIESGDASRTIEELSLPGGEVRHLLSYRFPFDDAAGCRILGGISVDVTDQMRTERALSAALAAQQTLLKEVHHRVKNNLQIISSLINMQAELLSDPQQRQVFQDCQLRVQAMAMIHDRLCGNNDLELIEFQEYVESLVKDLFAAHGTNQNRIQLRLTLEPVFLELNQAIPCGLIFNELVQNALKYAFPGARKGEIQIALSCDQDRRVTLRVADDGVGMPPATPRKRTLGLEIVNILTRQLCGKLTRENGSGVGVMLVFQKTGTDSLTGRGSVTPSASFRTASVSDR